MSKLLPNLPIENLTEENDYIGIIEKGNLLKSFFLSNKHEFSKIKVFAIYGEWGSGKSTLMKYLQKELKGTFNTFFFESWEYESDDNLPQSLVEYLADETDSKTDNFLKNGYNLMEGFAKSVTFKTPFANFNSKELINEVDKKTFFERKKQFENDFIAWENKITEKDKSPDYNIVFVDDLDRCEPENILNLLSAIKLFFTYGKNTIFLCGIDKKAIREAVNNKYGDVVKSNEYLEKIFDISFSMPTTVNNSKLVSLYFEEDEKVGDEKLSDLIIDFFDKLHFKNPRRIKKILNKYLIIKRLKNNETCKNLILPNIIFKDKGTLFETYLTLYLLILNEFEPSKFNNLFNLSIKKANFTKSLLNNYSTDSNSLRNAERSLISPMRPEAKYIPLKNFIQSFKNDGYNRVLLSLFSPIEVESLYNSAYSTPINFQRLFNVKVKNFEYYFSLFLIENLEYLVDDFLKSDFTFQEYKEIISKII